MVNQIERNLEGAVVDGKPFKKPSLAKKIAIGVAGTVLIGLSIVGYKGYEFHQRFANNDFGSGGRAFGQILASPFREGGERIVTEDTENWDRILKESGSAYKDCTYLDYMLDKKLFEKTKDEKSLVKDYPHYAEQYQIERKRKGLDRSDFSFPDFLNEFY